MKILCTLFTLTAFAFTFTTYPMKRGHQDDECTAPNKKQRIEASTSKFFKVTCLDANNAAIEIEVPFYLAQHSNTLKGMLEDIDYDANVTIPINNIAPAIMHDVLNLLAIIHQYKNNQSFNEQDLFQELHTSLKYKDDQQLTQLLHAVNYLDIPELYQCCTKLLADRCNASLDAFKQHQSYQNTLAHALSKDFAPELNLCIAQHINHDNQLYKFLVDNLQLNTHTLNGHTNWVNSVSFNPKGDLLASASWDKAIKIWNPSTGQLIHTLNGHTNTNWVNSVCFSPNGQLLVSASWDNTIKIWDLTTGKLIHTLIGHTGGVRSVCFSPKGNLIASASVDNSIKVWNPSTGQLIHTLIGHTSQVLSVYFSPKGDLLASASLDNSIKLWNPTTGQLIDTLNGHTNCVNSVCFSPNGQLLASASWDKTIKIWNPLTGKLIYTLEGHTECVCSVCFNPNGQLLVSASSDKTIKIWNLTTGKLIYTLIGHSALVNSVCFSPNGQLLASASWDNTIRIWDFEKYDTLKAIFKNLTIQHMLLIKLIQAFVETREDYTTKFDLTIAEHKHLCDIYNTLPNFIQEILNEFVLKQTKRHFLNIFDSCTVS